MNIKTVFVLFAVSLMTGCAGQLGVRGDEYSDVSEYKVTGKQIARAANDVGPDINDINTCPKGMYRMDHRAGGSADSNIKTTERGTTFTHAVEFGQSHDCE